MYVITHHRNVLLKINTGVMYHTHEITDTQSKTIRQLFKFVPTSTMRLI
jgi:hypothetical protein